MSHAAQPYRPRPCPECGGQRVLVKYNKQYPASEIKLIQPKRFGLFGANASTIDALSCLTCGYTTFYATQPGNLRPDKK